MKVPDQISGDRVLYYVRLAQPESNGEGRPDTFAYALVRSQKAKGSYTRAEGEAIPTDLYCVQLDEHGQEIPYLNSWYDTEADFLAEAEKWGLPLTPRDDVPE